MRLNPADVERLIASGQFHGRPHQLRQVMLELADRSGKLTQESVRYRDADPGSNKRCGTCDMFRNDSASCTLVEGSISPQSVCDRFEPRDSS